MGMSAYARGAGLGLALAVAGGAWAPAAAQQGLAAYQGAWVEQSLSCDKMFVMGQKGASFRKPVNIFVSAFIVSGNSIRTAQANCRVSTVKPVGDRDLLKLTCSNSISTDATSVLLARSPDGSLKRYFNEEDTIGTRYERCAP
ncbi:MAG: hypothetical protein DI527_02365 [Chelatococcus sp.]|nr:MAG: hypothetical protein DI527_02365 [Chelatococcus sp.]